jgi:hypothetical protein
MVPLHARRRLNGYGTNDYFLGDAYVRNQDDRSTSPMPDSLDTTNYALHIKSATDSDFERDEGGVERKLTCTNKH